MSGRRYRRAWNAFAAGLTALSGSGARDAMTGTQPARRSRLDARAVNALLAEMDEQALGRLDRWDARGGRTITAG